MTTPRTAMGTSCAVHRHRELVPIEVHHVFPLGYGGLNRAGNRVPLCANGHGSVHYLLELMVKASGGRVPWTVRRRYGRRVRQLAQRGYDEIVAHGALERALRAVTAAMIDEADPSVS